MRHAKPRAPLTPGQAALKALTHRLVELVGGGSAAAAILEISPSLITAYTKPANNGERDYFMPIHCVHRLEAACGNAVVSRWMAEEATRDGAEPAPPIVIEDIVRIAKEAGEAKMAIDAYKKSGTENMRQALRRELTEARDVFDDLLRSVDGL